MADPIIIKPIDLKPLKNYQGSLLFNNDCCAPLFPKESPTPTLTPSSVTQTPTPTPTLTPTPSFIPPTPEPSASRPVATPTPTSTTSPDPETCKLNDWPEILSTTIRNISIQGLQSSATRVGTGQGWVLVNNPTRDPINPYYIESSEIFEPIRGITNPWSGSPSNGFLFIPGERVYIYHPRSPLKERVSGYAYIKSIENLSNIDSNASCIQLGPDIDGEGPLDFCGAAVSFSHGERIIIGSSNADRTSESSGHARIYEWDNARQRWNQMGSKILGRSHPFGDTDSFGCSVSMDATGDRVAIGGLRGALSSNGSGYVSLYDWNGSAWVQVGSDITGEASGDNSGSAVSLSKDGNIVAIGAISNRNPQRHSGYTKIYRWSGTAWVQMGATIYGEAAGDYSGSAVSLNSIGDIVAIGAPRNSTNGQHSGHVKIYKWSGATWDQMGTNINGESAGDQSGGPHNQAVSLDGRGTRVAIGSPHNDVNGDSAGSVRVFDWDGSAWVLTGRTIYGEKAGDWDGSSVALSTGGDRLVFGGYRSDGNGNQSGHAKVYDWDGIEWNQGCIIDGEFPEDMSGWAVDINTVGDRIAIGAVNNSDTGDRAGHVRVINVSSLRQPIETKTRIYLDCEPVTNCIGLEDSSPDLYLLDNIEPKLVIATTEDGKTFKKKHSFSTERLNFGHGVYRFVCGYNVDRADLDNVISSQNNNNGILTVNSDYAKRISTWFWSRLGQGVSSDSGIVYDHSEATAITGPDGLQYYVGIIKITVNTDVEIRPPAFELYLRIDTINENTDQEKIYFNKSCPNALHPTATPTPTSSGPAPSPTPTPSFTPTVTPTLTSTPNPTPTTSSADPLTRAWDFSKTLIWGIEGTENEHGAGGTIRRAPEYDRSGGGNNSREASKNLYLIGADRADDNKGYGTYPAAEWYSTTWITAKDDQGGNMQYKFNKFYVGQRVNIYYPGGPAHPTLGVQGTNKIGYHNLSGRGGSTTRPNIIDQELSTLTVRKFERFRAEDPLNLTNEDVLRVWFSRTPPEPPTPEFGEGIVVKFETNADDHVNGLDPNFYVKLTSNTPITNNNFLGYVRRGDYDNTFLHRSIEDFIIQGGLAKIPTGDSDQSDGNPVLIPQQASIRNEPYNKNLIGTIGMSKIAAKPDSATSQFFFNLKNNPHLDSDSSGYTVFGNVLSSDNNNTIRDGMTLINLLGSRLTYDASGFYADFSERSQLIELPFWFNNTPPGNIVIPSHFLQIKKVTIIQE